MVTHIRLPDPKDIDEMLQGASKRSEMAERKLKTAVGNALASMQKADKEKLLVDLQLTDADVQALLRRVRLDGPGLGRLKSLITKMQAMDASGLTKYPGIVQDARELSSDEKGHVTSLATKVSQTMRDIANGHYDTYVTNVFGNGHETHAKEVFKGAADALDRLTPSFFSSSGIVVDTMRKSDVWCCGALTNSTRMALGQSSVEAAANQDMDSIGFLTLVHESTHALKTGATTDVLYEHHEGFLTAGPQAKLRTADYYKEVVRQIATGKTRVFVEGNVNPHLDETRSAGLMRAATIVDKEVNGAWIIAIRIHDKIQEMALKPGEYVGWENWLRNASKLMGITLHREAHLAFERNYFSANTGPMITSGDMAVIDNKIAMLAKLNGLAKYVMAEPTRDLSDEEFVNHVLLHLLNSYCRNTGLRFNKSIYKTAIVIRSLGALYEGVNASNKCTLVDPTNSKKPGLAELPEPMKSYDARAREA